MSLRLRHHFRVIRSSHPPIIYPRLASSTTFDGSKSQLNPDLGSAEHQLYVNLLRACLEQCKQIKNQHVFDEMPQRLAQASQCGKVIHAQSLKCEIGPQGPLGNAIVDLYAKCGNVDFAEKVFKQLDRRNVLAWNSLLSLYSRKGLLEHVIQSFGSLRSSGLVPNEFTYAIVSSVCARLKDVECGRLVHGSIIKSGFELSSFCQGALIDMYAKCNSLYDARQIFETSAGHLDTVSWTAMISGYVRVGLPEEAVKVFERMQRAGCYPDQVAFVTAINACMNLGRFCDACELFNQMPNPNVVAWNMMISGHAQREHEMEAITFFLKMRKAGITPSRSTLGSVLSAIASLAYLDHGLLIHALAIKQGLDSNVYVGSSLINMYSKCEMLDVAKKAFDAIVEKNIVVWNVMLGGYAQNGYANEVKKLFCDMTRFGIFPDEYTYTSILSACASLEHLEVGRQLHAIIIKKKLASNLFVGNALVDMYAKAGALGEGRKQFDLIKNRDHVSWNAIIVGYVQEEDEVEAFNMFQRMNLCGNLPDEVSLASILSACANTQAFQKGQAVHCLSVKLGFETSLYAGSSLIDMYVKCGSTGAARKVFSCMPQWSVVSMNALISGCAKTSIEEAMKLFLEMQVLGLKPSEITFASLIDACNGPFKLTLGMQIHCASVKNGLLCDCDFLGVSLLGMYMDLGRINDAKILFLEFSNPRSAVLWTAFISGHTQNDCSEEALIFYQEMRDDNVLPDQATFATVLKACSALSSLKDGKRIHSLIFHTGFDLDEQTGSALVDMYAKCGDIRSSVQVFEEMSFKKDVISWNSMIVGFAKNGYAESALEIFDKMKQTQVIPDDVTFLGVLTACSHAGRVSEGRLIFDEMVNYYGIQPRSDHYACMVDLLGRWGLLKEAEVFIGKLNVEPDAMIWASLLGACRIHGDEIRGQRAAEKLIKLEPQNSSSYVLLSNIYSASGSWDEAKSLRRIMVEKEVKKIPGCSWISVGQTTNLFVAGDKSHPSSDEICESLKYLTALMKVDNSRAAIGHF